MIRTKIIKDTFIQHPPTGFTKEQASAWFDDWLDSEHRGEWQPSHVMPQTITPLKLTLRDEQGNVSEQARINAVIGLLSSVISTLEPIADDDPALRHALEYAAQAKTLSIQANHGMGEAA